MGKYFTVKFRKYCLICMSPITGKRYRTYCSKKCREKRNRMKSFKYNAKWQRDRNDRIASQPTTSKVKCLICGRYYYQVGTHIIQRHKMTARKYREIMDLPVKRGILPLWLRKVKSDHAINNKTANNLKVGKKFWFKKHDKRAIINSFYKGRSQEMKRLSQEIYPHEV